MSEACVSRAARKCNPNAGSLPARRTLFPLGNQKGTGMSDVPAGFRKIPGFPRYAISEDGTVLSVCPRNGRGEAKPWNEAQQLTPEINRYGYLYVILSGLNGRKLLCIHTLVLEAFVGPRPAGLECRHLDGNNKNNRLENLCWGTVTENRHDRILHGTSNQGERCNTAKLTEGDVRLIRKRAANGERQRAIAKDFPVDWTTVGNVVRRQTWKHI